MADSETREDRDTEREERENEPRDEEDSSAGDEQDDGSSAEGEEPSASEAAERAQERHEQAQAKIKELEDMDEPPSKLEDWPEDQAKYVTFGGPEGEHSYSEGPEEKLGKANLERRADGSVLVEGEEVENPDEYKDEPVAGGMTDPDVAELPGERKKLEKMKEQGMPVPQAAEKVHEQRQERGTSEDSDEDGDSDQEHGSEAESRSGESDSGEERSDEEKRSDGGEG
jgi:hypothetical protein